MKCSNVGPVDVLLLQWMLWTDAQNYPTAMPLWKQLTAYHWSIARLAIIKYVMSMMVLQYFILNSAVQFIRTKDLPGGSLFPQEIKPLYGAQTVVRVQCVSSAGKAFSPLSFSPLLCKVVQKQMAPPPCDFSDSLDLTGWWNGAFTLCCPCRCGAVHFLM